MSIDRDDRQMSMMMAYSDVYRQSGDSGMEEGMGGALIGPNETYVCIWC